MCVVYSIAGVWEYIEPTRDSVCDLERRVRLAKTNEETMHKIMEQWSQEPLYQRKEDKNCQLLNLEVDMYATLIPIGYHVGDISTYVIDRQTFIIEGANASGI